MPLLVQLLIGLFLGLLIPVFITALDVYFDNENIGIIGNVIFLIILFWEQIALKDFCIIFSR